MKQNIEYLGKYLKRPPIGETRIKNYDGKFVTYHFLDHCTNTTQYLKLPVLDFIARLISHVPDLPDYVIQAGKHFRNIRYYGFLSNRTSSKHLPIVYKLYYYIISRKEIIQTKKKQPFHIYDENISPFQEVCMMCCKGLMIPVEFTNSNGETVLFHQTKQKVSMPDNETILARIILFQNEEI